MWISLSGSFHMADLTSLCLLSPLPPSPYSVWSALPLPTKPGQADHRGPECWAWPLPMAGSDSSGGHLKGTQWQVVWEWGPALWVLDPHSSPRAALPAQRQHSDTCLQGAHHCLPGPAWHAGQIGCCEQLSCPSGTPPRLQHPELQPWHSSGTAAGTCATGTPCHAHLPAKARTCRPSTPHARTSGRLGYLQS